MKPAQVVGTVAAYMILVIALAVLVGCTWRAVVWMVP